MEQKLYVKETSSIPIASSKAVQADNVPEEKNYTQTSFSGKTEPRKEEPIFNLVNEFTFMRESSEEKPVVSKKPEPIFNTVTEKVTEKPVATEEKAGITKQDEEYFKEEKPFLEEFRVIGQVFSSYILIEKGEELLLLDQHAAHERLNYEKIHGEYLKKEFHSQMLLMPKIIELAPSDYRLALDHLELFSKVGIMAEDFQDNSIVVREIPCEVKEKSIEKLVYEILSEIRRSGKVLPDNFNQRLLFLVACKMSVKANTALSLYQMEELAKEAFSLNGKTTCPHGRPLFIAFSKTYIETKFER